MSDYKLRMKQEYLELITRGNGKICFSVGNTHNY